MLISRKLFQGFEADFLSRSDARTIMVYFHGFPGPRPGNPVESMGGILEHICRKLGIALVAPNLPGLVGASGQFRFCASTSIAHSVRAFLNNYDKIFVVGYSWGAVTLKHLLAFDDVAEKIKGLALLAPLVFSPEKTIRLQIYASWLSEFADILSYYGSVEEIDAEIQSLIQTDQNCLFYRNIFLRLSSLVVQGKTDSVVPLNSSKALTANLVDHVSLKILENSGHGLEERLILKDHLYDYFFVQKDI